MTQMYIRIARAPGERPYFLISSVWAAGHAHLA